MDMLCPFSHTLVMYRGEPEEGRHGGGVVWQVEDLAGVSVVLEGCAPGQLPVLSVCKP